MEDLPNRQQFQVTWPQVNTKHHKILVVGLVLVLWMMVFSAVVGGVAGYLVATRVGNNSPLFSTITNSAGKTIQVTNEESAVISVVNKASPAVVSIVAKGVDPFSGDLSTQSAGTGILVDSNGTIVTNSHVVEDTTSTYTVVTHDQKTYTAKNISRDPVNDVAVLKIDGNFTNLALGDSSAIKVGQSVVAIGNALGKFDNTVTTGVISGVGRGITASDELGQNSESLEGLIQTDAAINPGNSGGPLLSLGGDVIGITTAAASGAQNIGFAVPINTVKAILANYEKNGHIVRPFLGVGTVTVSSSEAKANGLVVGALVQEVVPSSGADKAGIRRNDIIQAVSNQSIDENNSLAKVLSQFQVGQQVAVKIWRDGKSQMVNATLSESPSN